jgi:hypothetical protein
MNYDYLLDYDFDKMTEEEFFAYLDGKAEWLKSNNMIRPLPNWHRRLGAMVSLVAQGEDVTINPNKIKKNVRSNWKHRK